jgi:multiple sugar transport system ATP-binding protein
MEGGLLQQYDAPSLIKERPANLFTGTFVGEPPMNVYEATTKMEGDMLALHLPGGAVLRYHASAFSAPVREALLARAKVMIGVRPYAVKRAGPGVMATVSANQWLGDQTHIAADFAGGSLVLVEHDRARLTIGEPIEIQIDPSSLHVFDAANGTAISHGTELA